MIGDPLSIVRCDGASSAAPDAPPCDAKAGVYVRGPVTAPLLRAYVERMLPDWLFENGRDRCPKCKALDLEAARQLAAAKSRPQP